MNEMIKKRYDMLGPRVAEALKKKHYDAWYVSTSDEARELTMSLIPEGASVSWGGTVTVTELGIKEELKKGAYRLIDRDTAKNPEERNEMMRQALLCDIYLMSSNAISEDGQLVNIDGLGNRVAALSFGPKEVIVISGMNKVVKTVEDAWERARTIAAPINGQKFEMKTPCVLTGACGDCYLEEGICSKIVVNRFCRPEKRIKVILIGEDIGF